MAEAVHSLADIGNQLLLRLGIAKSTRLPTPEHPFGYMKDKFVFSLISAVGVFCIGAGATIINGFHALADEDHDVGNFGAGFAVLGISFLVEGFSFVYALRTVRGNAARAGLTFSEYLDSGNDPAAVAVMAEDGAALIGITIAAAATALVQLTDSQVWDGIGSILVGVLLAFVALFLIQRNRSVLIGRSMSPPDFSKVIEFLLADPVVKAVYDAKSEEIGPGVYRFSAELDFNGRVLTQRHLRTINRDRLFRKFKKTFNPRNPEDSRAFSVALQEYGSLLVGAVGTEVDRMERSITQLVPGVKYVDLEADRGRFTLYQRSIDEEDLRRPLGPTRKLLFDPLNISIDDLFWGTTYERSLGDDGGVRGDYQGQLEDLDPAQLQSELAVADAQGRANASEAEAMNNGPAPGGTLVVRGSRVARVTRDSAVDEQPGDGSSGS